MILSELLLDLIIVSEIMMWLVALSYLARSFRLFANSCGEMVLMVSGPMLWRNCPTDFDFLRAFPLSKNSYASAVFESANLPAALLQGLVL